MAILSTCQETASVSWKASLKRLAVEMVRTAAGDAKAEQARSIMDSLWPDTSTQEPRP
jgi:hypothetical protein